MIRVGLTGGIGSGKSLVAELLRALGAVVVDADLLAREIVEPGMPALAEIAERFGPGVIRPDGALDRPALAAIVFADADALADLNAITHPRIAERSAELIATAPDGAVVVYDVPLLVESGLAAAYDVVLVVDCPDDVRLERLVGLRGMDPVDARARMAAQATREERLDVADFVVDNSGPPELTRAQVEAIWPQLAEAAGAGT